MKYNEYKQLGYPIGSGFVEGSSKFVIGNRRIINIIECAHDRYFTPYGTEFELTGKKIYGDMICISTSDLNTVGKFIKAIARSRRSDGVGSRRLLRFFLQAWGIYPEIMSLFHK